MAWTQDSRLTTEGVIFHAPSLAVRIIYFAPTILFAGLLLSAGKWVLGIDCFEVSWGEVCPRSPQQPIPQAAAPRSYLGHFLIVALTNVPLGKVPANRLFVLAGKGTRNVSGSHAIHHNPAPSPGRPISADHLGRCEGWFVVLTSLFGLTPWFHFHTVTLSPSIAFSTRLSTSHQIFACSGGGNAFIIFATRRVAGKSSHF